MAGEPERSGASAQALRAQWQEYLARTPLSAAARESILRIETASVDFLRGIAQAEKKSRLARMSYRDFLLDVVRAHPDAIAYYQTRTHDLYGLGIDAVPALDCWAGGASGFQGMGLDRVPSAGLSFTALGAITPKRDYFFHFPDGNASIARMLVRKLIPGSAPGGTAEDIVTAKIDYGRLDAAHAPLRIRLNSTAVSVRNTGEGGRGGVEVVYAQRSPGSSPKFHAVRAKAAVLACWNSVIPHLCDELPQEQKEALRYGVKVPLVYTAVSLRSARALHQLGISRVSCPGMYHSSLGLDDVVSMGRV